MTDTRSPLVLAALQSDAVGELADADDVMEFIFALADEAGIRLQDLRDMCERLIANRRRERMEPGDTPEALMMDRDWC